VDIVEIDGIAGMEIRNVQCLYGIPLQDRSGKMDLGGLKRAFSSINSGQTCGIIREWYIVQLWIHRISTFVINILDKYPIPCIYFPNSVLYYSSNT